MSLVEIFLTYLNIKIKKELTNYMFKSDNKKIDHLDFD